VPALLSTDNGLAVAAHLVGLAADAGMDREEAFRMVADLVKQHIGGGRAA
jgi:hypothetical protein